MQIESIPIERINPAAYNPRLDLKPGDPDYERLKRSMEEFGFVEPLVWNRRTGNLVGGHQRLKILAERGAGHVDVSVVDLPPERERSLNVALNKIRGDWDERKLADLLTGLAAIPDFDVSLTGFDATEITHLLDGLAALDEEDGFDLGDALDAGAGQPPVTQPGELIELGRHRLLCGDGGGSTYYNTIFWDNTALRGFPSIADQSDDGVVVAYSDVQGGWAGTGNLNVDPQFMDVAAGDYRIKFTSPCKNAGNSTYLDYNNPAYLQPDAGDLDWDTYLDETTPRDLKGCPRKIGTVDIGAYEYSPTCGGGSGSN